MSGHRMDRALIVASLRATPSLLRMLAADCTAEQVWTPPEPGEWSIAEVVRHLLEGDRDTFLPRLRRMLAETRPVFASEHEGVSPSRGAVGIEGYTRTMAAHDTEHLRQIHDVRAVLGLPPKRCEARLPLAIPEMIAALRPRLRRILAEERPVFESFDPAAWARSRDHREGSFERDLEEHDLEHLGQLRDCRVTIIP